MKFWKILTLVGACIALALVPLSASAGPPPSETKVTIKGPDGDFSGKVKSDNPECESGREVTVLKKKSGKDKKVGMDTTEGNGDWSTGNSGQKKGKFYAKTPEAFGGLCEKGKSKTIEIG